MHYLGPPQNSNFPWIPEMIAHFSPFLARPIEKLGQLGREMYLSFYPQLLRIFFKVMVEKAKQQKYCRWWINPRPVSCWSTHFHSQIGQHGKKNCWTFSWIWANWSHTGESLAGCLCVWLSHGAVGPMSGKNNGLQAHLKKRDIKQECCARNKSANTSFQATRLILQKSDNVLTAVILLESLYTFVSTLHVQYKMYEKKPWT